MNDDKQKAFKLVENATMLVCGVGVICFCIAIIAGLAYGIFLLFSRGLE